MILKFNINDFENWQYPINIFSNNNTQYLLLKIIKI